jgi:5-methylcytosine-specific restriction endonuclease McrA
MPTIDLFGNITPDKTKEGDYKEYITSATWKRRCEPVYKRADNKCEKCGMSKWTRKLSVHHLNYDHFKNEPPEDLILLCDKCHEKADKQREHETADRNATKLEDARFDGWARKKYGDDWMMYQN